MFSCPIVCPSDCCKFESIEESPVVLENEIPTLVKEAEKIGVKLTFTEYGSHNGVKLYKWIMEGWCPFYKGRCTIHEKKPLSCRIYPLVLNLKTGEIYLSDKCLWVKINGPRPIDHFPTEKEALRRLVVKLKIR